MVARGSREGTSCVSRLSASLLIHPLHPPPPDQSPSARPSSSILILGQSILAPPSRVLDAEAASRVGSKGNGPFSLPPRDLTNLSKAGKKLVDAAVSSLVGGDGAPSTGHPLLGWWWVLWLQEASRRLSYPSTGNCHSYSKIWLTTKSRPWIIFC